MLLFIVKKNLRYQMEAAVNFDIHPAIFSLSIAVKQMSPLLYIVAEFLGIGGSVD